MTTIPQTAELLTSRDLAIVFPSFAYAEALWPTYVEAVIARCQQSHFTVTESGVVVRCTGRIMRYYVRDDRESYLHAEGYRKKFLLVSPFYTRRELRAWT